MRSFAFESRSVAVELPDGDFRLVGFADGESTTKTYLMLQRALEFDEQDVSLGMDTYYVEWCGQGNSSYGGISRFSLYRAYAEITFVPDFSKTLGGMACLVISFQLNPLEYSALREALGHIFEGSGCFVMTDA